MSNNNNFLYYVLFSVIILGASFIYTVTLYFKYMERIILIENSATENTEDCQILKQTDDIFWIEVNDRPYFIVDMIPNEK